MEYLPPVMLSQNASLLGASGMIADIPTTATGWLSWCVMVVSESVGVRVEVGG